MMSNLTTYAFVACFFFLSLHIVYGKEKVRLTDISTLTLYAGRHTTGRRNAPVPQLQCVGGSAGCSQFQPSVVQCYNRGSDGVDVQWECKADLDNRVKLGSVEVVCEGYDYPDDPYVLKGSCGLEYELVSKSGSTGGGGGSGENIWKTSKSRGFMFSDLLILAIAAVIVYGLYKTCLTTPQYSSTSSDYPDGRPGGYGGSYPSAPPPYSGGGFSQDYGGGADCHGSSRGYGSGRGGMGSGSFWSGAATGGILGYLFGQRNQGSSYFGGGSRHHGYTSDRGSNWDSWGSGGGGGGSSFSAGSSSSTSFGGTRRR